MTMLLTGAGLFILTHFGLSADPMRKALINQLGEKAFGGVYSLIAFVTFGLMIYGFISAVPGEELWGHGKTMMILAKIIMLVSIVLLVLGLMNQSPLSMMGKVAPGWQATGVLKITRHPVQWAMFLWGFSHLLVNSDPRSLVLFGTFVLVAGVGTVLMDRKFAARGDANMAAVFAQTSNLPFWAMITGKTRFTKSDIHWQAELIGLAIYTAIYLTHDWIAGIPLY
ncbi:MAG: NnrU family protein [Gammaproteobacteria bacterium]|nr:NnrU family protein [Gammaproteobacteria bacterium]